MLNFENKLNLVARKTDKYLKNLFLKQNKNTYLIKPMKYGLFSGGKRIRSFIIYNTGKIFDIDEKTLIAIGAAVECIHSYSLIHDDLPSMDNDNYRRGKLSTHKKFNEFTAILAGNSLLTLAFEILASANLKLPSFVKNELISTLASCSGSYGLAGGQYSDLTFEKKKISQKKVIKMLEQKTGELFGFCCESVAIIKKQNKKKRKNLKNIGIEIGLLFQIVDDLIDYRGDAKKAGKLTKKDQKFGKATLIRLLGYKKTIRFAKEKKFFLINKIKKYGSKAKDLLESLEFIVERDY